MRPLKPPGDSAASLLALAAEAAAAGTSLWHRGARRGLHARPLDWRRDRAVLLFFEDFETDRLVRGDRLLRRALRRAYHAVTRGQAVTGFGVQFRALVRALECAGYRVVVNDAALARRNPGYPVGVAGYPHVLERWELPNPAVLGPGLLDHPSQAPRLMDDRRFRAYLVYSGWMRDVFASAYGERTVSWFGGIDLAEWPDARDAAKPVDLLVYDKVLWDRERAVPALLGPIQRELRARGLTHRVLRYGTYVHGDYRRLLSDSRGMVFLCEHETQGFAYQEALASNVPVLAWDQGRWLDPRRQRLGADPVPATSVPYFSAACGERFASADEFAPALERFLARLPAYEPRQFVERTLSLEASARAYVEAYSRAGGFTAP